MTKIFQHFIPQKSLWNIQRALLFLTEKKIPNIFFSFSKHMPPTTLLNFSKWIKRRRKKKYANGSHLSRNFFSFLLNFILHARKGRTKNGIANDWRHLKEIETGVHRTHFLNAICIEMFHLTKLNFVISQRETCCLRQKLIVIGARHWILVYSLLLMYRLELNDWVHKFVTQNYGIRCHQITTDELLIYLNVSKLLMT